MFEMEDVSGLELIVFVVLAVTIVLSLIFVPYQIWTGQGMMVEILLSVLIIVQLVSLVFQIRESK